MCGRITATFQFSDIRVRWNLDRDLPLYKPRFNIAPEQVSPTIPVIVRHRGGNDCRLMHWGLIPHWAADPSIGNRMINARAETLTELPSFKSLVTRCRCIIPADGFYEWRKEGKRKVPMWVESFTIITTEPNELVRPIHNRMPVILQPEDEEQWLDASRTPFVKAKSLLQPYPEELMDAHDVSTIVNSAKYDGPDCIQPLSDDEMPSARQLSLL
jgi:putative SOS response-associated peptidase YedK